MKLLACSVTMLTALVFCQTTAAVDLKISRFDQELFSTRYSLLNAADEFGGEDGDKGSTAENKADDLSWETSGLDYKRKSPTRAFIMSLAVPGAGQYYYGSKVKAGIFLGAEAVSLFLYSKWNSDGNDLETAFMSFHDDYWSRENYYDYLQRAYGDTDITIKDDANFTHVLPTTNTQQYYEMTGKYDQFSWGWDDAVYNGQSLDDINGPEYRLDASSHPVPTSVHRDTYQQMRADANSKFDQSKRMLYVTMLNHLLSAFEAFVTTKRHNEQLEQAENEFASIHVRARLNSRYARFDTPALTVSYSF